MKPSAKRTIVGGFATCAAICSLSLLGAPLAAHADQPAARPEGNPAPATEYELFDNTSDTGFYFEMQTKDSTSATGYRNKDNSTPVYIKITKVKGAARMFVDGATDDRGSNKRDCTAGIRRARNTGEYGIPNDVREFGLNHARMTSWGETGYALVSGLWSPDSAYSHKPLGA